MSCSGGAPPLRRAAHSVMAGASGMGRRLPGSVAARLRGALFRAFNCARETVDAPLPRVPDGVVGSETRPRKPSLSGTYCYTFSPVKLRTKRKATVPAPRCVEAPGSRPRQAARLSPLRQLPPESSSPACGGGRVGGGERRAQDGAAGPASAPDRAETRCVHTVASTGEARRVMLAAHERRVFSSGQHPRAAAGGGRFAPSAGMSLAGIRGS